MVGFGVLSAERSGTEKAQVRTADDPDQIQCKRFSRTNFSGFQNLTPSDLVHAVTIREVGCSHLGQEADCTDLSVFKLLLGPLR